MKKNYQEKYQNYASKFWDLQQVKETDEERKFIELCQELQNKADEFREEISALKEENDRLTEKLKNCSDNQYYDILVQRDQILSDILASI